MFQLGDRFAFYVNTDGDKTYCLHCSNYP